MDIVLHFGYVLPTMATPFWCIGSEEARCIFIKLPKIGEFCSSQVFTILTRTACNHSVASFCTAGPEGAGEQVDDPSSDEEQATTASET